MSVPKICVHYNIANGCRKQQDGIRCPFLHICKHYIMDSCKFGQSCKRNHDINDEVKEILNRCGINVRRSPREIIAELKEKLSQNETESRSDSRPMVPTQGMQKMSLYSDQNSLVTDSAGFSSMSGGAYGGARTKMSVSTGGANGGTRTNMSVSTGGANGGARTRMSMTGRQLAVDSTKKMQICLHNLQEQCCFKDSCDYSHKNMPYQWQTRSHSDGVWEDLEEQNNLDVELEFCNPEHDECVYVDRADIPIRIFFEKMEAQTLHNQKTLEIRRLSTVSSKCYETRQPLTTRWCWFWLGPDGKCMEYGAKDSAGYQSKLKSGDIEMKYLANPEGQCQFETQGYNYTIDFTTMLQLNVETKIKRKVKRRPKFVDKGEVERMKHQ